MWQPFKMLVDLQELTAGLRSIVVDQEWSRFHSPKNLAMALAGEAGELVAEFQWLTPEESGDLTNEQREAVELEMADVLIYLTYLADRLDVDLNDAVRRKLRINHERLNPRH